MKKIWKKSLPVFLALVLTLIPTTVIFAEETETETTEAVTETSVQTDANFNHVWPTAPDLLAESAYVLENSSSRVLYEKDAETKRYPASTTKILTALIAIENCSLDETVTFSEEAVTLEELATNIKAVAGEEMPLKDVLYGLMLQSGNDCANALAEHVAGSVSAFAEMMNARAAEIGCTGSHFVNPHGLFSSEHYTTARDLALIAQEAFKNSTFVDIISADVYYAEPTNLYDSTRKFVNTNLLIQPDSDYYDPDVIGGKTGYLDESGRCLVSFATRGNLTVITVELKGPYAGVFGETRDLLNYMFDTFSMSNVAANELRFAGAVPNAKVLLDPAAQILTLNAIPFDQLESTLTFAEDLSVDRRAEMDEVLAANPGRSLYAVIDYAYADHDLGSVNVYLDPTLEIVSAGFSQSYYVHPLILIIFALVVLIVAVALFNSRGKRKKTGKRPQPATQPQTYYYRKKNPGSRKR